jgi:hypothetical protein
VVTATVFRPEVFGREDARHIDEFLNCGLLSPCDTIADFWRLPKLERDLPNCIHD